MTTLTTELIEFTLLFINFMSQISGSKKMGKIFEVSDTLSFVMFSWDKITDPTRLGVDFDILRKVTDDKSGRQYVFAGHSMGCISALKFVRELVLDEGANPPYALICSGAYRTPASWNKFMENPRYPKERSIFYVTGIMESFQPDFSATSYAGIVDPFALNTKVGSTFSEFQKILLVNPSTTEKCKKGLLSGIVTQPTLVDLKSSFITRNFMEGDSRLHDWSTYRLALESTLKKCECDNKRLICYESEAARRIAICGKRYPNCNELAQLLDKEIALRVTGEMQRKSLFARVLGVGSSDSAFILTYGDPGDTRNLFSRCTLSVDVTDGYFTFQSPALSFITSPQSDYSKVRSEQFKPEHMQLLKYLLTRSSLSYINFGGNFGACNMLSLITPFRGSQNVNDLFLQKPESLNLRLQTQEKQQSLTENFAFCSNKESIKPMVVVNSD